MSKMLYSCFFMPTALLSLLPPFSGMLSISCPSWLIPLVKNSSVSFVQYASDSRETYFISGQSLAVLRIGSMEAGALLNDAFKEYEVNMSWCPNFSGGVNGGYK